jgi:hypothetical protein
LRGQGRIGSRPARVAPGETLRLHQGGFAADCDDNREAREGPDRNVRAVFRQGSQTWGLATIAAEKDDYTFDVELKVLSDAKPVQAVVNATGYMGEANDTIQVVSDTSG